jgi:Tudor domain
LAQFEGEWYRATAYEITTGGDVIVQFIEYGNIETLKPEQILPTPSYMKFDVCARLFTVESKLNISFNGSVVTFK